MTVGMTDAAAEPKGTLLLQDGTRLQGISFGAPKSICGEAGTHALSC